MLDEGGKIENSTRAPLCDLVTLFYNAVLGGLFIHLFLFIYLFIYLFILQFLQIRYI